MTTNPYLQRSPELDISTVPEKIGVDECWRLLDSSTVARLAVVDDLGPDIFPINYLVSSGALFFRSAPGRKIISLTRRPEVAVEIDGTEGGKRFSVVVRGTVRRLDDEARMHESGVLGLATMTASTKWNYFEVTPRSVEGRLFRTSY
ncbi:pyridoxamine 5'-phosphate oxidase family protein [Frigoribacterium sp. VKM Ac-2530]|uniref:pyridoxamine 5'-phosphate oxidase family protein n=1 Tax=Frigoribacterium sp. VKM Ac-2530 TaxID=2783822 RepID=UPI00188C6DDD|nr:pyridoxamine 5'-phosphate oxidase family protein [Frigoribacterium sp. VKM Ac-2530]MBF4578417.1 pyridoxamine 5'-phosphate oxidase family protein [Frigoribacterium sp. VKM Ac-2530]